MENRLRQRKTLAFKIFMPMTIAACIAGTGLLVFLSSTRDGFILNTIQSDMESKSNNIYSIGDQALNNLLNRDLSANKIAIRIAQAKARIKIFDFLRETQIEGVIQTKDLRMFRSEDISDNFTISDFKNIPENQAAIWDNNNNRQYVYHFHFAPWQWQIFLIKNDKDYTFLLSKVKTAYLVTGLILGGLALLLFFFIRRSINTPVNQIIRSLKQNTPPSYKGAYEFEFLSDHISEIMLSLQNQTNQLQLEMDKLKKSEKEKATLEDQLRQAHKMEAIGTLAGGIAHEFNNILAAMIGYTGLAMDEIPEGSQAKSDLDKVTKAGKRAKDLVKQILTFSHQNVEELTPIKIHPVVKEAIKLLQPTTPSSIELRQDICTNCKTVMANSTMIHQVLINLYTNAIQSMAGDGLLEICLCDTILNGENETAPTEIPPGEYVQITVSDNGPGIDPTIQDRIFDPFFTTKEVGKGTGMGLSVVHGIIKKFSGFITVNSDPGKGASFNIYFPAINAESDYHEDNQGPVLTGNENILFVDDEMMLAHMGKQMLEKLGYKVSARTSSVEALEAFRAQPEKFDLVITDQTMPNISGDELAKRLIEIRPDIPVIICSGYSSTINPETAKEFGIRAFVVKPVDKRTLAHTIRQVLDEGESV